MNEPTMLAPRTVAGDTTCFGTYLPVPGLGLLAANSFLIGASQPVLVDTGVLALREAFVDQLRAHMPLEELRWIWLTHTDPDHLGALDRLLELAPQAKVITTFLGFAKLNLLMRAPPPDRVRLLNPGERLSVGDRELLALAPPVFDAPETTALLDSKTGAYFSADCFGGAVSTPVEFATAIDAAELRNGCIGWATVDAPWLGQIDRRAFARNLEAVRQLDPSWILSAHLPPARGMTDTLLGLLADATDAAPFQGPNQEAFVAMAGAA